MKWEKQNVFTWQIRTDTALAEISKVSGNGPWPYMWKVLPLPAPKGASWVSIDKGSERTLREAKGAAERVLVQSEETASA